MLAGQEDSESAQAHAQELLDDARLLPQRARNSPAAGGEVAQLDRVSTHR